MRERQQGVVMFLLWRALYLPVLTALGVTTRQVEVYNCISCVNGSGEDGISNAYSWHDGAGTCVIGAGESCDEKFGQDGTAGSGSNSVCCSNVECCVTSGCRSPVDVYKPRVASGSDELQSCNLCCEGEKSPAQLSKVSFMVKEAIGSSSPSSSSPLPAHPEEEDVCHLRSWNSPPVLDSTSEDEETAATTVQPWYNDVRNIQEPCDANCPPCAMCSKVDQDEVQALSTSRAIYMDGPCTPQVCAAMRGVVYWDDPCLVSRGRCECFCSMANELADKCPHLQDLLYLQQQHKNVAAENTTSIVVVSNTHAAESSAFSTFTYCGRRMKLVSFAGALTLMTLAYI